MKDALKSFGISQETLVTKQAKFTSAFIKEKFSEEVDVDKIKTMLLEDFTQNERDLMALAWLAEKSELIFKNYEQIKKGVPLEEIFKS